MGRTSTTTPSPRPSRPEPGSLATIARSFDHVDLVVSSREASVAFYLGLLGPLGWSIDGDIAGERGERVTYLASEAGGELGLRDRQSGEAAVDRYDLGLHHLAFRAASRELVDERARWAHAGGTEIESGPREYEYSAGYYAVFLRDPDGLKLEIVHRPGD